MERPSPDLTGYREAQVALIATLGSDVEFFLSSAVTWPEGTPINPESGEPFDPTVAPASSGVGTRTVRCGIAIRGSKGVKSTEQEAAVGSFEDGEGMLIVPIADWTDNDLDEAAEAEIYDERYEIKQTDEDGIGDTDHRMLVYIRQK